MKKLFTLNLSETEQFTDKQDVIELVNCPLKEMMCKVHLNEINKNYLDSEQFRNKKDYIKSIDSLKIAFNKTTELLEHPCTNCAQLFRQSILKTMLQIHNELDEMSKGFFGDKNYMPGYLKAVSVLTEFKKSKYINSVQLNENKERFLGNYLN
jgi:hypothetical protein